MGHKANTFQSIFSWAFVFFFSSSSLIKLSQELCVVLFQLGSADTRADGLWWGSFAASSDSPLQCYFKTLHLVHNDHCYQDKMGSPTSERMNYSSWIQLWLCSKGTFHLNMPYSKQRDTDFSSLSKYILFYVPSRSHLYRWHNGVSSLKEEGRADSNWYYIVKYPRINYILAETRGNFPI